jgi:uncharacterized protein YndB with AHSA1/START domain
MLEIVTVILGLIAAIVIGALVYASTRPDTFEVRRSMVINAPPEKLFPLINDLKVMNSWNPFVLRAPEQKGSYSGPQSGPGAAYDFEGRKSGRGRIEIAGGVPARAVQMRLVMTKPFACDNRIDFTLEPRGDQTNVTWAMKGPSKLVGKVMGLFMDCDKMCGDAFVEGLSNLKAQAEAK